jgi:hypothetical protein
MARNTFFSFHYTNDVWRANVVRNSWVTKPDRTAAGFIDYADFEKLKAKGDKAVKDWIDVQLMGTSVTVVLIGSKTDSRPYVKYELEQSYSRRNGMLGIYIHSIKDQFGKTSSKGTNIFGEIGKDSGANEVYFSVSYPTYDWVNDNGSSNLGIWIEAAAKVAGR